MREIKGGAVRRNAVSSYYDDYSLPGLVHVFIHIVAYQVCLSIKEEGGGVLADVTSSESQLAESLFNFLHLGFEATAIYDK
jgi:hypothetical protein